MNQINDTVCIILAGGHGKRMGTADKHKVCFPILGRPAIVRAIDAYKKAGLRKFIVVVGQMSHQVMATVSAEHPEVTFVLQREARGTGHAALAACHSLAVGDYKGSVLITMGDKVIDPGVISGLRTQFEKAGAALSMVTLPFHGGSSAGRVLLDGEGSVLGIVEKKDLDRAEREQEPIKVSDREMTMAELEAMEARSNGSLYLFQFSLLWEALKALRPNNEQGELYLTDTVGILRAGGFPVHFVDVPDPLLVMAFNTPAELLAVEEAFRARHSSGRVRLLDERGVSTAELKPAREWLALLDAENPVLNSSLHEIYGADPEVVMEQRRQIEAVVEVFIDRYGPEREMVICRAPGRVNLMGRHIEHRGGDVNVLAISREAIVAAAPRADDCVELHNVSPAFPFRSFCIRELLSETSWDDWVDFIDSATVRQVLQEAPGDWSHYARAPLLRLQHECGFQPLKGMDCVVGGNIPMGAGLSSSSALVVAFAEIAIAFNGLSMEMSDFIDLCGEGEWFVGSRGGSGDHAAIRASKIGSVSQIGFFPFRLKKQVPLPSGLRVVLADSGFQARKSDGAKDAFNHRIASYQIGQMLLQRTWPAAAGTKHLRDLCPHHLKVEPSDVYRALKALPERITRTQIRALFGAEDRKVLDRIFGSHAEIAPYDLRGVVLYGLAECSRAETFSSLLERNDLPGIGEMMGVSHDGDRVVERERRGDEEHDLGGSDELDRLMAANTGLACVPGAYACSTPQVDTLVDLATRVEGVVGAQLSGAGLGGCIMILVKAEAVARLTEILTKSYYEPQSMSPKIYTCQPVQGVGLLSALAVTDAVSS